METTENQKKFREYYRLANQLMEVAKRDTLAEVARSLALLVTYYESKCGRVSMHETLRLLQSVESTDEEVGMAANAMEYLTAVLGDTTGLVNDDPVH